ncbi:MAG: hypothetical protein Q8P18_09015 [Pseudomonadota bacterium]|nr:hypothetical protein [Pseudomonadota bacterium]
MTLLALSFPALAGVIVVDPAGGSDATTIQAGIELAVSGDTVEVAPGTYTEDLDFQARTIAVEGRGGAAVTLLNGTGTSSVVRIDSGEGEGTRLAGFTISGGDATESAETTEAGGGLYVSAAPVELDDLIFRDNAAGYGGGAMLSSVVGARISNSVFEGNSAPFGGGLYVYAGSAVITSTSFSTNTSNDGTTGYGGGLVSYAATLEGTDLTFLDNAAMTGGGHLYASGSEVDCARCTFSDGTAGSGAGVYLLGTTVTLAGGDVYRNVATTNGGGIYAGRSSSLTLASVDVEENAAAFGGGVLLSGASTADAAHSVFSGNTAQGGGGLYLDESTFSGRNTLFRGNVATSSNGGAIALDASTADVSASVFAANDGFSGGAVHVNDASTATFTNVTMTENGSSNSAGGVRVTALGTLTLDNTIIAWSTEGSGISGAAGSIIATTYGDLYENAGGATSSGYADPVGTNGNVSVNPEFVGFADDDAYADDLHLVATSPLIDVGDPLLTDADGSRSDIGAFGGPSGDAWDEGDSDVDGYSMSAGDCDDTDPGTNPGIAADACGGGDQDCDGVTDEDCEGDTDTDTDSDTDTDTGTDDTGAPTDAADGGCGCATTGSGSLWLGLIGLAGLRRRRG